MLIHDPWQTGLTVEIDPELSSPEKVPHFGFWRTEVVGERRFLRIDGRHLACLAVGDYDRNEICLLRPTLVFAIIGGRGYVVSINGGVECEVVRDFPIINCIRVETEELLLLNTFSDIALMRRDGSIEAIERVVDDDLEIECAYPLLKISGTISGDPVRRVYDVIRGQFRDSL